MMYGVQQREATQQDPSGDGRARLGGLTCFLTEASTSWDGNKYRPVRYLTE